MQDVTKDRDKYIGGSDIPIIMGISKFKTRWQLLQEKATLIENEFEGNVYTEYGNTMEPKIREYISEYLNCDFKEDMIIDGNRRYHADGVHKGKDPCVLEIKTTSNIKDNIEDYQDYLVQLLYGMGLFGIRSGLLAIYRRPEKFSEEFDKSLLDWHDIDINDFEELLIRINLAVERFTADLEKLIENPFLEEEDLQPKELVEVANAVLDLELQLKGYKALETDYKALKTKLKALMEEQDIKKWTTTNGVQITLVKDGKDTVVRAFDESLFMEDYPELHEQYMLEKPKKGRSGYVKITI